MGTLITNEAVDDESVSMGNALTSVFFETLCLAGGGIAALPWQKDLMIWFAQRDWTLTGMGFEGFDISRIIWDAAVFEEQKSFIIEVADRALKETNWNLLGYKPDKNLLFGALRVFKNMIQKYGADKIDTGNQIEIYDFDKKIKKYEVCEKHKVYKHAEGCIICNNG